MFLLRDEEQAKSQGKNQFTVQIGNIIRQDFGNHYLSHFVEQISP
jgi:hypothetical protein